VGVSSLPPPSLSTVAATKEFFDPVAFLALEVWGTGELVGLVYIVSNIGSFGLGGVRMVEAAPPLGNKLRRPSIHLAGLCFGSGDGLIGVPSSPTRCCLGFSFLQGATTDGGGDGNGGIRVCTRASWRSAAYLCDVWRTTSSMSGGRIQIRCELLRHLRQLHCLRRRRLHQVRLPTRLETGLHLNYYRFW
jgi:hypothetical protein